MEIKSVKIGERVISNNLFLAPMAGYTDYGFRHLEIEQGAGVTFTELASAKGMYYNPVGTAKLLYSGEDKDKTIPQIFGSEEYYMRWACENLTDFDTVDINMGCPVPKVYKNGEGSALLKDVLKAEKIIKECVKSGKNITVKIRTGLKQGDDIATEYCKMAENSGAKLVTIHGRVREAYYSGEVNFKAIEKAKKSVKIPIIANGGIFTVADANEIIDKTGADGIMIARGAVCNPFLFGELLYNKKHDKKDLLDFMIRHLDLMKGIYGDERASLEFRKFTPMYLKGIVGSKNIRDKINSIKSVEEIKDVLTKELSV